MKNLNTASADQFTAIPQPPVPSVLATSDQSGTRTEPASDPVPAAPVHSPEPVPSPDPDLIDQECSDNDPAKKKVADLSQPEQAFSNKKTPADVALSLIEMVQDGHSPREAATALGLNIRTAYRILADSEDSADLMRAATRRVLAAGAARAIEHWQTAMQVGAQKKGNHAPARDWLLHAGVIDELSSDSANVRIAINIGTDDKPMKLVSPLSVKDE